MSIEVKETIKRDGKLKGCHIVDGKFVDSDGEVINLVDVLYKIYGATPFDLSVTTKTEAVIDVDEEVDIDDLAPDFETE